MAMKPAESEQGIQLWVEGFFREVGLNVDLPDSAQKKGSFPNLLRRHLRVERVERGRVVCVLTVHPETNLYGTLHGGMVAAVAQEIARACVRTVAGDKEFFVGEAESSYLAAARLNVEVEVTAWIVRQGRNVVVTSVEFMGKEPRKLLYTSRATFYNIPVASL